MENIEEKNIENENSIETTQIDNAQFVDTEKLKEMSYEIMKLDEEYKRIKEIYEAKKDAYKSFLKEHNLFGYKDDNVWINMIQADRSTLEEKPILDYLKAQGLTKYIHTKEYFDVDELYYAATKNLIDLKVLNEHRIIKIENRLNVKKPKKPFS